MNVYWNAVLRLGSVIPTVAALTVGAASSVPAQSRAEQPYATRAMLQSRLAGAEAAMHTSDRAVYDDNLLRYNALTDRLSNGDFNVGDRIALRVPNVAALTDTFPVHAGRVLDLPDIGQIQLSGVLWSELTPYLTRQISKFIVNPSITAQPLIRVQVDGAVNKPGFYSVRPDMLVSDAIMSAGGPSAVADVTKTAIRRNGKEIVKPHDLRADVGAGATVDQLDLRAGDEIFVGEQFKRDWADLVRTGAYVAAVLVSLYGGSRLFQ